MDKKKKILKWIIIVAIIVTYKELDKDSLKALEVTNLLKVDHSTLLNITTKG